MARLRRSDAPGPREVRPLVSTADPCDRPRHVDPPSGGPLPTMEFVFVVPRTAIFPEFAPHGLSAFGEEFSHERFQRCVEEEGFFVEREYAEKTPTLKQVIPYTLVTRGEEILLLQRTKGGGTAS